MKNFIKMNVILLLTIITGYSNAQQITTTNPNITPVQAVEDILLGAGIQAFNITYNTSAPDATVPQDNVQEFDATGTTFPLATGVLMTTNGTGNLNDPDLDAITGGSATNGAIIEFDFVPNGDTLSFNYIFASTEYTSFTCSNYNDVFGFFISGPGINGPFTNNAENIATVPGTNVPVAINTVNSGTSSSGNTTPCDNADPNWQANSIYFTLDYNTIFSNSDYPISGFNGATVVLPANASLSCNDTFHIKLAIANDSDTALDSGVFLEAGSFSSNAVDISIESSTSSLDTVLVEGCTEGFIYFTRPFNQTEDSLTVFFEVTGTADQGVDFPVLSPGDSVTFLPGEDTVTLIISPVEDGTPEVPESVTVSAYTITACGDTIFTEGTIWIIDKPPLSLEPSDTTIFCNDSTEVYVGIGADVGVSPYEYEWFDLSTDTFTVVSESDLGEYYYTVEVTDLCGTTALDSARVFVEELDSITLSIQAADTVLIEGCTEGTITFTRLACDLLDTLVVYLEISGTADEIDDYGQLAAGDSIFFVPGEDTINITITPIDDGLPEGPESVIVNAYYINTSGDTISAQDSIWIIDKPPLNLEPSDTTIYCGSDSIDVFVGIGTDVGVSPYEYEWFDLSTDTFTVVSVNGVGEYYYTVEVTDLCGTTVLDSARILVEDLEGIDLSIEPLDTMLIEGCTEGNITFSRFACDFADTMIVYIVTSGTADEIDDYDQLAVGDSIFFIPGEDTIDITIIPIDDGIAEGPESVIVTAYFINANGDTISAQDTIWIMDKPPLSIEPSDTTIYCSNDTIEVYVNIGSDTGVPPYEYEWFDSSTDAFTLVQENESGEYYYIIEVTDYCGTTTLDSARLSIEQTLSIDTMFQIPTECGEETGIVSGQGSGYMGTPNYEWSGPGANSPNTFNDSVWTDLSSGWYYFTIEDDVCSVLDSIFLEENPPPTAAFTANPALGNAPLDVEFINNSDPADLYEWDFGNGEGAIVNNLDNQNTTYNDEGIYIVTLTVTEGSCTDQATQEVIVTLVYPLDYDMPNVFTPNGDASNNVFTLNTENAVSLDLVILNRWGNVVYESSEDVNASWNGKVQNTGQECNDGTYFYKFTIVGEDGVEIEEHGFVHLIRGKK